MKTTFEHMHICVASFVNPDRVKKWMLVCLPLVLLLSACTKENSDDTQPGLPSITSIGTSEIGGNSVKVTSDITSDGGFAITERGICYSSSNSKPTVTDSKIINGTSMGQVISAINGLTPKTTYYARAFATNKNGTAYGSILQFTTAAKSSNAFLAGLSVSTGILTPGFVKTETNYTVSVENETSSLTITPTLEDTCKASVKVNSAAVTSGMASGAINLVTGQNTINIEVTAEDGTSQTNYKIVVTRKEAVLPPVPTNFTVNANVGQKQFELAWDKVDAAESYTILYKRWGISFYSILQDKITATSFTYALGQYDLPGAEYSFQVVAVNKSGKSVNNPVVKNWMPLIYSESNDKDTQLNYPGFNNNNKAAFTTEILSDTYSLVQHGSVSGKYDYWCRASATNGDVDYYKLRLEQGDNLTVRIDGAAYDVVVNFVQRTKSSSGSWAEAGLSWSFSNGNTYQLNTFRPNTTNQYDTYIAIGTKSGQSYNFSFEITH